MPSFKQSPDLAAAPNHVLGCCQRFEAHRAARVQLLVRDTDLRTEAEFEAVGKAGGSVDVDGSSIDLVAEPLR